MCNDARACASFGPITLVNRSTVVLKSLACICCNSTAIVMSNNPFSHSCECCALCACKLPPSIRARLTSERPLHAGHSSPRLTLMTSQSRQKTAFKRGRTPASRWFLVSADIYTNLCRPDIGLHSRRIQRRSQYVSCQSFQWLSQTWSQARFPRKDDWARPSLQNCWRSSLFVTLAGHL